ncbi:bifunctional diguanylate cyclase/phosphodiesterase [Massilia pseudoviolaceinigra]|uniref:bifunctional diguanylate cyclase/phosphodiesterase n=1 Tax=Massilia pseudoviolaceinigra TaxID=3057165 RepID=UPI0027969486|nr:EAL domain-containing protein [Massilia sp. CCM 9206]MDQ1920990.1 EAL domain-containing protein [Massilia sp. CCM 9206]
MSGTRARFTRLLGLAQETHISLPLFAMLLLVIIWMATDHFIGIERSAARDAARDSSQELIDTYEAQMQRNLGSIDQTLKVLKYAVELNGTAGALPALNQQGLLPSGLVFVVSIADRGGMVVASNPPAREINVSSQSYFAFHRDSDSDTGTPFVSQTLRDSANPDWHLHFTRRLNDKDGRFAGVAIVEVDPAYFTSGYERSRLGESGALGLYGTDGVFRALRIGDKVVWGLRAPHVPREAGAGQVVASDWDGVRRYTSVRRLHGFSLTALVGLSEHESMAAFEQQRRNYLWVAGSGSALLVIIVTLVCGWSWQLTRTRRRIRRAQETYAAASEASLDAFFVMRSISADDGTIADFVIEATNTRAEKLAGMDKPSLRGLRLSAMLPAFRDNGIFEDLIKVTLVGGVHEAEWLAELSGGRTCWLHRQVVAVEDGVVAIVRDITERKVAEERIRHMAHHDELTGLPNRSLIRDRLDQAILQAQRRGRCVAVAFIDLDGFKLVNDGLGHNAGDELLKVVGARMSACVRREDTLGRFGGDEFIIILPDQADNPMAVAPILEKIRQAVTEPVLLEGQEVQVSCSMGVVMYPRDGADPNTLMMNADAAMYRAKEMGNNNFQFYAREMNASVEEKLVLLEGLRGALDEGQFHLLYQPKVDLRSGLIFGVEALIRWEHPEHGVVSPLRFIGLAEESGLIVAIGDWVLHTACRQNKAWQDAGLAPITMSVNVSPRQFEEKRLVERVAAALRESALAPGALELEVTESLIMRDLAQSVGKMRELEAMGLSLSIDDFGTGYSSLSALKSFPISSLKIDKSFVRELADNTDDQAIAMAVISLGHKLNLRVIAEGVETEQQCTFLRDNDCDEMQGYLFSRPVPAAQIAALLAEQARMRAGCALPGPSLFPPQADAA